MTALEGKVQHVGETSGAADNDHDLIHDLSKRLDALWRYDQYIANAEGKQALQDFWRECKHQDRNNIEQIKEFIAHEIENNCGLGLTPETRRQEEHHGP